MTTESTALRCPKCENLMAPVNIPKAKIYVCRPCDQVMQDTPNGIIFLQDMLERNALGDDRVRAAISAPHVTTVRSFLDIYEQATRVFNLTMAQAVGELRPVLAQIENRIDAALSVFSGLDLVVDRASDGLMALREARELASTTSVRTRGILQEEGGSAESP